MSEDIQTNLEYYDKEMFQDKITDTSDTNVVDSFSQVLESSLSNIPTVNQLKKPKKHRLSVWLHFNTETAKYFGKLVCRKCEQVYKSSTGVSTLRKHLENHQIQAPKKKQATLQIYRKDPYNEQEQQKRDEKHTDVNISEAISFILNKFKLNNKIMALTTDNESAVVVCSRLLAKELENKFNNIGFSHYKCAIHVLNLVAKQELIMAGLAVNKMRQLMAKIKASVCLCDELRALCDLKGIKYLKAKPDIEIRWNSTYYMLQKFKNMELALNLLSVNNNSISELYSNYDDQQKLQ
ncbi:21014_t:CDS:2, partial [Cetraspora pellucida]